MKEGRAGDAVVHFMMLVGMPEEQVEGMHQHPMWPLWESVGLTLVYDAVAMGEDASIPTKRAALLTMPALVLNGSESFPFMSNTAKTLAAAMPEGEHLILQGQTHELSVQALAPALIKFFES